jgi:hypothetical protein
MNEFKSSRISQILQAILIPISLIYIAVFIYVAVSRINYPFELNWLEGGISGIVGRVLDGQCAYPEPSLESVSFTAPPLYYMLAAIVSGVAGSGFMALRLVSLLASLFCLAIIYFFVHKETNSRFSAIVAAGLFAAFYNVSGSLFDVGVGGPLNLFLLLLALYLIRFFRNNISYIFGGILLFLATFTSSYSFIMIIFLLIYTIIFNRKAIIPVIFIALALTVAGKFLMDWLSGGWFSYYVLLLPLSRGIVLSNIFLFWTEGLLKVCMIPLALILLNFYMNFQSLRKNPGWRFNFIAAAGMIVMAWLMAVHTGDLAGAQLPALAIIAIIFGISANDLLISSRLKLDVGNNKPKEIAYLLILLQFISLIYNPLRLIPTSADRAAGQHVLKNIEAIEGDVFIPSHGYLAEMAGKPQYAHARAILDVLGKDNDLASTKLKEDIESAFEEEEFSAVIYDRVNSPFREFDTNDDYLFEKHMFPDNDNFYPVSGIRTRPQYIFVPKSPSRFDFPLYELFGPMPLAPLEVPETQDSTGLQ